MLSPDYTQTVDKKRDKARATTLKMFPELRSDDPLDALHMSPLHVRCSQPRQAAQTLSWVSLCVVIQPIVILCIQILKG